MGRFHHWVLPALLAPAPASWGATYHTLASAQEACFGSGHDFAPVPTRLTQEQLKRVEEAGSGKLRSSELRVWKVEKEGQGVGWFFVEDVIGKHELIRFALALKSDGTIRSLEVMDYRENYGAEIRNADWRVQFVGRTAAAPLKLGADIRNVSGATLSCRHVTEGVKRLLMAYELVLKSPSTK